MRTYDDIIRLLNTFPDEQACVASNVDYGSAVCADEWRGYSGLGQAYDHRKVVYSAGVYVDGLAHTNGIGSFWSTVKRSYVSVYHWWSGKHLHCYAAEHVSGFSMGKTPGHAGVDNLLAATVGVRLSYSGLIR